MNRAAAAFALLLLSGCVRDFAWRTVVTTTTGGRWDFQWRDDHELWGFGGDAIRRDRQGWEVFSVCPEGSLATEGAFEPDGAMWVLCGDGLGQGAVRYDAAMAGTVVELPIDGRLKLVPLIDEVLVIGETQLWAFDGAAWTAIAEHPLQAPDGTGVLQIGGTSRDSIYATHPLTDGYTHTLAVELQRYDGAGWAPMALPGREMAPTDPSIAYPVALDHLAWYPEDEAWYLGPWLLDGATAVLEDDWLFPSSIRASWFTRDHELVFAVPGAAAQYSDRHDEFLWVVGPNDTRADEYLGAGPWASDPNYQNCNFLGGTVFAPSRNELLAEVCSSDGSRTELMEGRR